MKAVRQDNSTRHLLVAVIFILVLGAILSAIGETSAQSASPGTEPGDTGKALPGLAVYVPSLYVNLPVIMKSDLVISGYTLDPEGEPIADVVIETDIGPTTTTDATGFFIFDGLPGGVYELTPVKDGYTFTPTSRTVTIPNGNDLQFFIGDDQPPEPPEPTCSNVIVNGDFEDSSGWFISNTVIPAAYSTVQKHGGAWSMRTGIIAPSPNLESSSSAMQQVTIPAEATEAELEFWLYAESTEPPFLSALDDDLDFHPLAADIDEDAQVVFIYDTNLNELERIVRSRLDDREWVRHEHDMSSYIGETIVIYFGSNNNGNGGFTGMYVDDVALQACQPS